MPAESARENKKNIFFLYLCRDTSTLGMSSGSQNRFTLVLCVHFRHRDQIFFTATILFCRELSEFGVVRNQDCVAAMAHGIYLSTHTVGATYALFHVAATSQQR